MLRQLFLGTADRRRGGRGSPLARVGPHRSDFDYRLIQLLSGLQELAHYGILPANAAGTSQGSAGR